MLIELKVERIEEEKVVLKNEDNETIIWPKNLLPKDIKEGSLLAFTIKGNEEKNETEPNAKDILNEILDVDSTE